MKITFKYIGIYWFPFIVIFCGICLVIAGVIGSNFGIPHLFRDDPELSTYGFTAYRNSPAFLTQLSATFLVGILWTFTILLEGEIEKRKKIRNFVLVRTAPLACIPLFAAIFAPFASIHLPKPEAWEIFRMVLGSGSGLFCTWAFICLGHAIALRLPISQMVSFLGFFVIFVVGGVALYHKLIPTVSIFLLLSMVSAVYFALKLIPKPLRVLGFFLFIVLMILGNGVKYKYTFPGFQIEDGISYYDRDQIVKVSDLSGHSDTAQSENDKNKNDYNETSDFLIDPLESLEQWRAPFRNLNPKLVVVTTSGGAYRAAFWTAIVLDALRNEDKVYKNLSGLIDNIRLVTGASGGMVGAAYFVTTHNVEPFNSLVGRLEKDTKEAQSHTRLGTLFPIPRDSLSPVAQQLAQRDVFKTFLPWTQYLDRGRVLESQWLTLKNITFAKLREGELKGWRPSLILSPMLIETGQPILISNLNLYELRDYSQKEAVEFFKWFPKAHPSFALPTAVRMNATFPYVSPAVSLPTEPCRRVVDAGYYDNYGVNLAVAYLRISRIRDWIQDNTSGVVILQIRAFPIDSEKAPETARNRTFQWLTSPLEGAGAARESSMVFRNNQEIRALQDLYEEGFIQTFTLENAASASMSWYLPRKELKCMRKELYSAHNTDQLKKLKKFWNDYKS